MTPDSKQMASFTSAVRSETKRTYILLRGLVKMSLLLMRRYAFNTVTSLVTSYVIFAIIVFGGMAVGGQTFASNAGKVITWLFIFNFASSAYTSASKKIYTEAQWGTLEQLYIAPFSFERVLLSKLFVDMVLSTLLSTVILGAMLLTTRQPLHMDVVTLLPTFLFTLLPAIGLGLIFAGLALLYKRVSSVFRIAKWALMGLVIAPVESVSQFKLLPIALGSTLIRKSMVSGVSIWEFQIHDLVLMVATGLFYFWVGYRVFGYTRRKATKRGTLGQY